MELVAVFAALILLFVVLVAPVMALVRARRALGLAKKTDERTSQLLARFDSLERDIKQLQGLVARVYSLEQEFEKLKEAPVAKEAPAASVRAAGPPSPPAPRTAEPAPPPLPPELAKAPPALPPPRFEPAPKPPAAAPPKLVIPSPVPPPKFAVLEKPSPPLGERLKGLLNVEEKLGTNWLNKLGIIILVIGVALFLAYQVGESHLGRVLVGYLVSGALLGSCVYFERRERWRIFARAGIGGGWALLFFVTYAMYHVPAARVIDRQWVDLVLLLVVGIAMVAHTLRYDSQVVTGLAFLLAFSTVTVSRSNAYSLSAGALLALGLVVVVVRKRWYELEVFGILASYLNHYFWLRPIIEPMGGHRHPFPEFLASASLLVLYWAVFRASYLFRRALQGREEATSTVAALLNSCLLLAVMKYQSVHPELAFWFLLALGAVELGLGQLPVVRRRRTAFVVLTTIGTTLLVAALPFRYSGATLPILWLAEAEAFFLAGVFTREVVFRRLGMLAGLVVAADLSKIALGQLTDPSWAGLSAQDLLRARIVFVTAALVFYANAHGVPARYPKLIETALETISFRVVSYVAGWMVFLGAWWLLHEQWVAVGWAAGGLALAFVGHRLKLKDLSVQANFLAALAALRALFVNPQTTYPFHGVSVRLITMALVAGLLYAFSRWSEVEGVELTRRITPGYAWAASLLTGVLMWYELRPASVVLGWALLGVILFESGFARHSASLRFQGYVAMAASFARIFFVNLNAAGEYGEISPRVFTTAPLALAFYYLYGRLEGTPEKAFETDRRFRAKELHCYFGTIALAALVRFEMPPDWVAAAWAVLVVALLALAWKSGRRVFLQQGYLVVFGVLFRSVFHNFYQPSYFSVPFWQSRTACAGVAVVAMFLALPFAFELKPKAEAAQAEKRNWLVRSARAMARHPDEVFFFIPFVLLTVLLALEIPSGLVTVAWGIEAVAVFLFALWVGRRSYRLSALGLLLLCVGKIVFKDVWGLTPRDRYLTFIVLGAALLGVSYLYTRYRETIRQYL